MALPLDYEGILKLILDIGAQMVISGGEVSRVEESIQRMCASYGATDINVFIITSNIQVTIKAGDGRMLTQIRRIKGYDANFDRLDYLNDLCRYICNYTPDIQEIRRRYREILNRPPQHPLAVYVAAVMAAGGFAAFFGGSIMDCICAAIMGMAIMYMKKKLSTYETNQIASNFVLSVIGGVIAILLVRLGIGNNEGYIMIGGIMLLIPGIALTNGVRDMLTGDTASGLLRLVDSILVAGAIASGFAFTILVLGGLL